MYTFIVSLLLWLVIAYGVARIIIWYIPLHLEEDKQVAVLAGFLWPATGFGVLIVLFVKWITRKVF